MKANLIATALTLAGFALTVRADDNATPGNPRLGPAPEKADPAPAQEKQEDAKSLHQQHPQPADEAEFVQKASAGGKAEVKMAQAAVEQAKSAKVRELAETLVKDHTKANERLAAAAKEAGVTLADDISQDKQSKITELKAKSGEKFDSAFLEEMALCHQHDIALFEAGQKVAKSEEINAFIKKTLPTLREHARMVAEAQGKSGSGTVGKPKDDRDDNPNRNDDDGKNEKRAEEKKPDTGRITPHAEGR